MGKASKDTHRLRFLVTAGSETRSCSVVELVCSDPLPSLFSDLIYTRYKDGSIVNAVTQLKCLPSSLAGVHRSGRARSIYSVIIFRQRHLTELHSREHLFRTGYANRR